MTLSEFSEVFALLAKQLRQTDADEADIRAYFTALRDLELEFLAMAAKRLAASAEWFPKTSEWRAAARDIERERTDALRAQLRRLREPICSACDDTGWASIGAVNEPRRVRTCSCQKLRRLEVLGRRPWPQLAEATSEPGQQARVIGMLGPVVNKHGF